MLHDVGINESIKNLFRVPLQIGCVVKHNIWEVQNVLGMLLGNQINQANTGGYEVIRVRTTGFQGR